MGMKWVHRSGLYQVTIVLTYVNFLIFGTAFSVATWWSLEPDGYKGLWMECLSTDDLDFENCSTKAFGDDDDWHDALRGLWVGGAFFYVLALIYSIVENCCAGQDDKDYGITAVLVIFAGCCGAAGVVLVAVETSDDHDYHWGYILACASCGIALILAIILLLTKSLVYRSHDDPKNMRTADFVYGHKGHQSPYSTEFTNHGFSRDDVPLANGVGYHHTPHQQPYTMYQGNQGGPYLHHSGSLQRNGGTNYPYNVNGQRYSMAESADLSNGYTSELLHAEQQNLSRSQAGYPRLGDPYSHGGSRF